MIETITPTLTGWGLGAISAVWGGVFNHLWQSTVFAAVAALLALALRRNHARARYWLWLAASCKFLVPFSLLVTLGITIGTSIESVVRDLWPSAPAIVAQPEMTIMIDEISQPFTQAAVPAVAPEHQSILPVLFFALWACGCAIVLISWFRRWLRVRAAVRSAKPIPLELSVQLNMASDVFPHPLPDGRGSVTEGRASLFPNPDGWGRNTRARTGRRQDRLPHPDGRLEHEAGRGGIRIMSSPALLEPGIFGIFRPVLLLPEGIADRLTPKQMQSILAHELCHVKRRDNLAAAIHMLVEAAFWFHPLVWWIGARLVEERERACDEEVLRSGSEPGVYAESILQICKFYLESPLKCVAGVTGSDLKKRIESIMSGLPGRSLTPARKLLLIAASVGAIAGPVIFGVLAAPHIRAQSQASTQDHAHPAFEVASVKPNKTADNRSMGLEFLPGGGLSAKGVPLYLLITFAYDLPIQSSRIAGGPDWLRSDRFDIEAKADKDSIPKGATVKAREAKTRLMLQTLLADRFKLVIRIDKKELPVYAAVVGRNGPKLQKSKIDEKDCPDNGTTVEGTTCHTFFGGIGRGLHGDAVDMSDLAGFVANWTDRPVIDKTGLQGLFNIQTDGWVPMTPRQPSPDGTVSDEAQALADPARPTLQMVLDRLGLKLESQKAPIDMYVIERAEKPTDNFEPPAAQGKGGLTSAFAGALAKPAAVNAIQDQPQGGPALSFEVASIKPSPPGIRGYSVAEHSFPGGRFTASNATLKALVAAAYRVYDFQISGGPSWLDSYRVDIQATAGGDADPQRMRLRVEKLLADRFGLALHRETKQLPVYALVTAKSGPKIKLSEGEGDPEFTVRMRSQITAKRAPLSLLSEALSQLMGRPVLDQTGLRGGFEYKLDWMPDTGQIRGSDDPLPADPDRPSILVALPEQLGLRLEATKGPVEMIVIDRAEKPTDNFEPLVAAAQTSDKPAAKSKAALAKPSRPAAAQALWEPAQGSSALSFEVASIKLAPEVRFPSWSMSPESGRLNAKTDVKGLIEFAYGLHMDFQVSGGPGGLNSEKYAVAAKAAGPASRGELQQMMQALLAERFRLTIHRETRELPVLALVVGNKGPKLSPSKFESDEDSRITIRSDRTGPHLIAQRTRMDAFVIQLMGNTGTERIVVDRTGLKGAYDFKLEWTPERPSGTAGDSSEPAGPTIFTALQEQLGLKLESTKAPVEVIVIDHAEKPTEN